MTEEKPTYLKKINRRKSINKQEGQGCFSGEITIKKVDCAKYAINNIKYKIEKCVIMWCIKSKRDVYHLQIREELAMKMKMVKKLVAMALVSTMALSGLAACGDTKEEKPDSRHR